MRSDLIRDEKGFPVIQCTDRQPRPDLGDDGQDFVIFGGSLGCGMAPQLSYEAHDCVIFADMGLVCYKVLGHWYITIITRNLCGSWSQIHDYTISAPDALLPLAQVMTAHGIAV